MLYVFIGCLTFGVVYSAIAALLGGAHGFDHGGFDHGGISHDVVSHGGFDHAGIDQGVIGHAGGAGGHAASDASGTPSPLNPLVIAGAITAFGASGLIGKAGFGMSDLLSTMVALAFAGVIGVLLFFGIVKLIYSSQSNSIFSLDDLINTEAEIITPIPVDGLGEIAYVANGMRYTLSAKSSHNEEISRGTIVVIREVTGNAAVVHRKMTIDDVGMLDAEVERTRSNKENKI